jgi:hypothetical protein
MIEEPVGVQFEEIPYIYSFTRIPKETFMNLRSIVPVVLCNIEQ